MRKRNCLVKTFRVAVCVGICVMLTALVGSNNTRDFSGNRIGTLVRDHFQRTLGIIESYRYGDASSDIDGFDEVSMSEDSPAKYTDHKDASGEWFEKPMVLQNPGILSLVKRDWADERPKLTLINIDYKIGPIFAMKHQLQKLGVRVIDKSLSSFCGLTGTCSDLSVIERDIGLQISREEVHKFRRMYRDDPEFESADGFICIYPVSMCELFIPFNKTLIMIVEDRFELGRTTKARWLTWNHNLQQMAEDPKNVLVTTNSYDFEYLRCFTGLSAPVVPFACTYVTDKYQPHKPSYLLMPIKKDGFERMIIDRFRAAVTYNKMHVDLHPVTDIYGSSYTVDNLRQYSGLVVVPHQLSFLALTEILRHNIPIYFPSVELYTRWHIDTGVISERSLRSQGARTRWTKQHIDMAGIGGLPDPNDNDKLWAVGFWMTFAEYYSWPGVKYFDSIEDLATKINGTSGEDLFYASERMRVFNEHEQEHIDHFWETTINKLVQHKNNKAT